MPPTDLSVARRVDAVCDRFEAAWRAGRAPRIEDYISQSTGAGRADLLRALLAIEIELRRAAGEAVTPTAYRQRFPDDAEAVESALSGPRAGDTSVSRESVRTGEFAPRTDTAVPNASVPTRIGRFTVTGVLGAGAFGRVYRATDPQLGRDVAIKMPLPSAVGTSTDRERFLREARAAAGLHHPNICPVHEVGEEDGHPYIVMGFVPGQTLAAVLKARKEPLAPKQAALIARKLALALDAAHKKGVVHRDLKPANVMFDKERRDVVVTDFGLARAPRLGDAQTTRDGVLMGTPAYMSPEQARGDTKVVGPASDQYALGVMLYEMLTGRRPFTGTVTEVLGKILHVEPEPVTALRPDLDPGLAAVCTKAMSKDPAARYASMRQFADALAGYASDAPLPRPTVPASASAETAKGATETQRIAEVFAFTEEAVEKAIRKHRTPTWVKVAGGLLAALLLIVPTLVFFARTPTAKVTIQIDVDVHDKTLAFILDGKQIEGEALTKEIELKVGSHRLEVKRNGQVIRRYEFNVSKDAGPRIELKEEVPPPTGPRLELVRELKSTFDETSCWLSPDGLTIYFDREGRGDITKPGVYRAVRSTPNDPFGKIEFVCQARHPALSADRKSIVAVGFGQQPAPLHQQSRDQADSAFAPLSVIPELRDQPNVKSPWLTEDGLTLVYQRGDGSKTYPGNGTPRSEFVVSRRKWRTEPWSVPERLPLAPDPIYTFVTWPMITADGLTLFLCNGGTRFDSEILYATRATKDVPFGNPRRVFIDGKALCGRSPRYVAATRELYLCRDAGTREAPDSIDVWVVKNFDPDRPPAAEVLFLGDSITHGWEGQNAWKTCFGPLKAANFGIRRGRTGDVLARLTEGKHLEGTPPKIVVLMVGTNNTDSDSAEQIADGIQGIVKTVREKSPGTKVLLLGIFPRGEKPGTPIRGKIAQVNKTIAKLDDGGQAVKYLDIGPRFLREDGSIRQDLMPDCLHPSPRGYQVWAEAITPVLKEMLRVEGGDRRIKESAPSADPGFVRLFNGKDLTGWKTHPDQPGGWTVEDGLLTGRSTTAHHLFTDAGDYEDFHLRAECRTNRFGNGGIYFRTPFAINRPSPDGKKFPTGYETQIIHEFPRPVDALTGSIRSPGKTLAPVARCDLKPDEWFTLEVIARGRRLIVKVSGVESANVEDAAFNRGHLALQAMSDAATNVDTRVQFRTIEVRRLTPEVGR